MSTLEFDAACMKRALRLARRGLGFVEPNPMVGCVIAKGGRVIAEGFHHRYGGPHAEVQALKKAGPTAKGSTAYVTLEPCCHFGKTPPCTRALISAGVRRVVAAIEDPFVEVSGRGIRELREAGLVVELGHGRVEAEELMAPYLKLKRTGLPYVILKWAQSLDGKLATVTGDSKWISGQESRQWVHRLRARVDAIVVGIGTVLTDDPLLTAREIQIRRRAIRVVLDSRLRIPSTARLLHSPADASVLIATTPAAFSRHFRKVKLLREAGAEVLPFPRTDTRRRAPARSPTVAGVELASLLRHLGKANCTNVLVEGGAKLLNAFLTLNLADEAWVFISPRWIGGRAAPAVFATTPRTCIFDSPPLPASFQRFGPDLLARLDVSSTISASPD